MSEITVSNTDWAILSAVKTAIAAATVGGEAVFASAEICTSVEHLMQTQLVGDTPRAIVLFKGSDEQHGVDDERFCRVSMELILASRAAVGADASDRIQEMLRLKNAAVNAVQTDPPSDAVGAATSDLYRPALVWGPADIELSRPGVEPWVMCRLGLEATYAIADAASH